MSKVVDKVVNVGSFGLIDDFSGAGAAADAASAAAGVQSGAAVSAAEVAAQSQQLAIDEQRRQFDITQGNLAPRIAAGNQAMQQQMALLGMGGQEAQKQAFAAFGDSPGQRFLRERQEKALLRNASAIGGLGGGNVRTALQEQAVGLAAQDYNNQFNRLGAISSGGQAATSNLNQFGANMANNVSNSLGAMGQSRASGIQNAAAANASGILGGQQARAQADGQMFNLIGQGAGAAATFFSDRRLKRDIEKVGEDEIGGIYHFKYNDNDQLFKGRMADELQKTRPDDVYELPSGYLAVSPEFAPEAI